MYFAQVPWYRLSTVSTSLNTGTRIPPLRALRQSRGWSLEWTADRAGLDSGHLSKLERGLIAPSLPTLWKLARALDQPELERLLRPYVTEEVKPNDRRPARGRRPKSRPTSR